MSNFDNTNRGVLFNQRDKKKSEKSPDYSGSLNVDGAEHFLDAWIKTSQNGTKFMSVSVKRKDKQADSPPQRQQPRAESRFDDNSDVPF